MASGKTLDSAHVSRMLRVLANESRLNILHWLAQPRRFFDKQPVGSFETEGVCVTLIQKKVGLTQSTTSSYLTQLHRAGLVSVKRVGQWTYYKRNEQAIQALVGVMTRL